MATGTMEVQVFENGRLLKVPRYRKIGGQPYRRFRGVLERIPTGGPYEVVITCGNEVTRIADVHVGDLWLMAGQSNMEGSALLTGAPEPHPMVRCFTMGRRWEIAQDPLHFKPSSPDAIHGGLALTGKNEEKAKARAKKGGGVGVHFGKLMYERTGVPQGLIATAHGGTSMEQWDPALRFKKGGSLYGSMMLSLEAVGQPLAGVLWAQGESEALPELAKVYTKKMIRMVSMLRRHLQQPHLPWLMVQVGRFAGQPLGAWPDFEAWNNIQEQQRRLPSVISHCAIVPSIDLEIDDIAHIGSDAFPILARRLVEAAGRLVLRDPECRPTVDFKAAKYLSGDPVIGSRIEVSFAHVQGDLASTGPVRGFALLDGSGRSVPAIYRVTLKKNKARLHIGHSVNLHSLVLRYGHGPNPLCTLTDSRGMAVPAFGPVPIEGVAGI